MITSGRLLRHVIALGCCLAQSLGAQARWSLQETLRIGSEEDGPFLFTDLRGIAVGEKGSIFVLDFKTQEIRLFDAQGKFVKRVARQGSGPGEIRNANGMLTSPDGRMWVNDPNNGRYSLFKPNGDFDSQVIASKWGYGYVWEGYIDRGGVLWEYFSVRAPGAQTSEPFIRGLRADGTTVDTLPMPGCAAKGPKGEDATFIARSSNSTSYMGIPFIARPMSTWDARGFIWCSSRDRYEVLQLRVGNGDTVRTIVANTPPLGVSAAQRQAAIDPIARTFEKYGQPAPDFGRVPKVRPAIDGLLVDDGGWLWVRRASNDSTRTLFDLWDANGKMLASVTAPWRLGPAGRMVFRGDTVYAAVVDDNDVPAVVRAVLRKGPGAP